MNDHVDMSAYIAARSDQLNADDLLDAPRTITITKVTASPDSAEQPVSVHYEGDAGKPFKPCKTVRRIMVGVWGKDAAKYVGRSMTLYRDPTVAFGGMQVGGLRVSHMSDISENKTVALQVTRGRKAPHTVKPLVSAPKAAPATSDPAEKWAGGYIANLAAFTTVDEVKAFAAEKATKLAELESKRPDLHEKVTTALATRTADLTPGASDFSDDDMTTPGAATADEKSAAETSVEAYIERANAAPDAAAVEAIIKEADPHKAFMSDDLAVKLEVGFDKARKAFEAKAETAAVE